MTPSNWPAAWTGKIWWAKSPAPINEAKLFAVYLAIPTEAAVRDWGSRVESYGGVGYWRRTSQP